MIALVDYGAGNLTSVQKGLAAAGGGVIVARSPANLANAAGVVVPGVGHFAATASLDDTWRAAILEGIGRGRPLLGICLGMQWLFEGSTEAPGCPGLGVLEGRCARLEDRADSHRDCIHRHVFAALEESRVVVDRLLRQRFQTSPRAERARRLIERNVTVTADS